MSYTLQFAGADDALDILSIYAPYVLHSTATFEFVPPSLSQMTDRIIEKIQVFPWLVCRDTDGTLVGYAYGSRWGERPGYDWCCETSVYIHQDRLGAGAGTLLYQTLLDLLRRQGYRTAYAKVVHPNLASQALHEKLGFVRQGLLTDCGYKFGGPVSVAYYACPLAPPTENPPLPAPMPQLLQAQPDLLRAYS